MLDKTFAYLTALTIDLDNPLRTDAMEEVTSIRNLPEIVLLAGSARFKVAFEQAQERLALEAKIVLAKCVFKPGNEWPLSEHQKDIIHAVQFRMCDIANRVHIVNVDGYIGMDTYNLIKYAVKTETPVTWSFDTVILGHNGERVTTHHFMQATRRTVEFAEATTGG